MKTPLLIFRKRSLKREDIAYIALVFLLLFSVEAGCQPSRAENSRLGRQEAARKQNRPEADPLKEERAEEQTRPSIVPNSRPPAQLTKPAIFRIGGWIPRWRKPQGVKSALENISLFASLSPFAFRVDSQGAVTDTLNIDKAPFSELVRSARAQKVKILPTFVWNRSRELSQQLASVEGRKHHIISIIESIQRSRLDGADIDYESKDRSLRDPFSAFLTELSEQLHQRGLILSCTIEPRTSDSSPAPLKTKRAWAWANDYEVINRVCDQVRIMAYDQWRSGLGDVWRGSSDRPTVDHASIDWIEKTIVYTKQRIEPSKLVLGVATYGWEFIVRGKPGAFAYQRRKALSYPDLSALVEKHALTPSRKKGGELLVEYRYKGQNRLVIMPDAKSIERRIKLAKQHQLGGVVLFKIDGLEDKGLWRVLEGFRPDTNQRK